MKRSQLHHAVGAIERSCAERDLRLTTMRRRVLELILAAERPVGAYALLDRLHAERPRIAPTTVYRALEFLLENRFIHRIESLNAFIACVDLEQTPHESQFVVCEDCGSTAELHDSTIAENLRRHGQELGFQIHRQVVELRGVCATCQQTGAMSR